MTEDEMVVLYHQLSGDKFEQASGDSEEQGSLVCCSPLDCKESDTVEQLKNNCLFCFRFPMIVPLFV